MWKELTLSSSTAYVALLFKVKDGIARGGSDLRIVVSIALTARVGDLGWRAAPLQGALLHWGVCSPNSNHF